MAKRKVRQSTSKNITPFKAPLQAVITLLEKFNHQGVIIGGVAVSLLGSPRYTVDLDAVFLLGLDELPELLSQASVLGIESRIPDPAVFARKKRVLLLRHNESGTDIDISLGILPFEVEMVARSRVVKIGTLEVPVPTPEDLIIMKAIAHRPKDLADIQAIVNSHPVLDTGRIQSWVEQFGEALDNPELWQDIEKYLNR